jgi:hypothetical protein
MTAPAATALVAKAPKKGHAATIKAPVRMASSAESWRARNPGRVVEERMRHLL